MKIEFFRGKQLLSNTKSAIDKFSDDDAIKSIIIFSCDKNNFSSADIERLIPSNKLVFGAIFPQVIYKNNNYDTGIILIGINEKPDIMIINNLSDDKIDYEDYLNDSIIDNGYKTLFVLVDGFATRISAFIENLFNVYGLELNFIGGGAGSLDMVQKPCLITNNGLIKDAAIVAAFKANSSVGVQHGWQRLCGPFKVTHSLKNSICMLDNKAAFDVYKEVIENDSGKKIDADNFFDIAKAYPFGISKMGTESIIRDPIMLSDDNCIVCVGDIPQDSFVHIFKGEADMLIKASGDAFNQAKLNFENRSGKENIFFIDCISRALFLKDDFNKEIEAINYDNSIIVGALTLGEIANSGKDYLEFYNKTAVVALIDNL